MEAINIKLSYKILLPLLVVVALLTVTMPRKGIFKYSYQKGGTWNYETLVAPFDFPVLKTSEEIRSERLLRDKQSVGYYKFDESVSDDVFDNLQVALENHPDKAGELIEYLAPIYAHGIFSGTDVESLKLDYELKSSVVYVVRGKNLTKLPSGELYELADVRRHVSEYLVQNSLEYDLVSQIMPNVLFDRQLTELKYKEAMEDISVSLGVFKAGETIIRAGDTVTSREERVLDSFKAEFNKTLGYDGSLFILWLGDFLISVVLTLSLLLVVIMARPKTTGRFNEMIFVLAMFVLSALAVFMLVRLDMSDKFLLVPFPVFALYLVSFFRNKLVMPAYSVYLLPLLLCCENGMRLYLMFLFAGCIAVFVFSKLNKGWHQFLASLCIFISLDFVYSAFAFIDGSLDLIPWTEVIYMLLGSLFVVLAYPLVYLFEIIFNLVSDSRLTELSDTNNKLLRELGQKAPGTFQHCIAVMNMADYVGRDLDVDVHLLRAGALYHDVGKIQNPSCFVENQIAGVNFHADLTPKQSAANIIRHITDGVALAEKYKLPSVIRDFITTHHGTTSAGYFYTKYLNDGGDPNDAAEFFYPGPAPKTKEQVILMLCDSVEAASRTLSSYDYNAVSAIVDKIYSAKFEAGQFNESDITLSELETLRETLKQYIVQLHHGRIAYPERIFKQNNTK